MFHTLKNGSGENGHGKIFTAIDYSKDYGLLFFGARYTQSLLEWVKEAHLLELLALSLLPFLDTSLPQLSDLNGDTTLLS